MTALYILLGIVLLIVILIQLGPKSYRVDRSIVVNKSRQEVYNYIKYLKQQDEWSPWGTRDPNMEKSYSGTDGEPGFVSHWKGNKDVGEGEQEIINLVENERVDSELRFLKPWKSRSDAFITLADAGEGSTKVTWGFSGTNDTAMMRLMGLFMNMDKMIGKDFEEGLNNLKENLEG